MPRCTLKTIARKAGLGLSTVSYALRGDPKIPAATAERVRRIAASLGYKVDPGISHLMAHIRAGRAPQEAASLAFVWIEADEEESRQSFNADTLRGAKERAQELGYRLHEFWLRSSGMTSERLSDILKARGIVGVVFSGCHRETAVRLQMDWGAHAAAIVGNAPWTPELHRAAHDHHLATKRVMLELAGRGYKRPGGVLDRVVNERTSRAWEGAFLAYHTHPEDARELLRFDEVLGDPSGFRRWIDRSGVDALVISHPSTFARIRKICPGLAKTHGFAALDLLGERQALSGVDVGHNLVASNAVDLVVAQLQRNESGVPTSPHRVLVSGYWHEGQTLR